MFPQPTLRTHSPALGWCRVILLATAASSAAATHVFAAGKDPLVLVGNKDFPPLSYVDEHGEARGIDVDVARALSAVMDREVRVELMDWAAARDKVRLGEADGLTDLGFSEERSRQYDFTEATVTHEFRLFVRSSDLTIHGPGDLARKVVGVTPGGLPQTLLGGRYSVRLVSIQNYSDGFDRLLDGTIDAFAADAWVAAYILQQRRLNGVAIAGDTLATGAAGIALRKGNDALRREINVAIQKLKTDGTLGRIEERWRPQEMLVLSRQRIASLIYWTAGGFLVTLFAGMGVWVLTLKRQIRVRKRAEAALRASEERFQKAFEASPDCIAISDFTGVIEVNERFEELTGYARSEIIGRNIADLEICTHAVRDEYLGLLRRDGSVRNYQCEMRRKDGEIRTVLVSGRMIDIDGRQCCLAINRDITDQRRAEGALQRSESKYRELVENANDVIFTVDREGYCLSMNRAGQELTGFVAEDPRGTRLNDLVVPEQQQQCWMRLGRVLSGEDLKPFEVSIVNKAGKRLTLELVARPVYENGAIVAAQGIARDVTNRKELESRLQQAQKMDAIGRLAAGVAHDFNNLLTIILGSCEDGVRRTSADHPLRERLHDIRSAAERAASLTGQLLAFSRRQITQRTVLDLNRVVSDIERMVARLIGEDIAWEFKWADSLWAINADAGQLHQLIMNLAVNARDAMPSGGRLTIETQNVRVDRSAFLNRGDLASGDYVLLTVTDTGVGMDEQTRSRVFEPFFTTKGVGKGTGLGLATVYAIVQQSGGFVCVDSEPGRGSTFRIYFPRVDADVPREVAADASVEAASGSEHVLIVEDENDLRELLHDYLSSRGYIVASACSGEEGLRLAVNRPFTPTLLVTDVVMPGMGGRALADTLCQRNPAMRVLYLSGYTDEAILRHGALPKGTRFLQKPFALDALAREVRRVLDEQSQHESVLS